MGCGKSKPAAAAPGNTDNLLAQKPEEPKPVEPKPEEAKAETPVGVTVPIRIASAHGLRAADLVGNKSDVFVEVSIDGKPESKITSGVASGQAAPRLGAPEGEKDSIEVELNFVGELKNVIAGDKLVFIVRDKDLVSSDCLGKVVVTDFSFGGRLNLEGAGDGYSAFLMVQVGEGSAMTAAIECMKDAAEKAKQALAAAFAVQALQSEPEVPENAKNKTPELIEGAQVKGSAWCC